MPLDPSTAESVGADIAATLAALPKGEDKAEDAWKIAVTKIFAAIVSNAVANVTIPPAAIATSGSATNQVGPAAPVPLTGTIT